MPMIKLKHRNNWITVPPRQQLCMKEVPLGEYNRIMKVCRSAYALMDNHDLVMMGGDFLSFYRTLKSAELGVIK